MKCYQVEIPKESDLQRKFVAECDGRLDRDMEQVAQSVAATPDLRLLGLTGPTCSGKTTAAKKLTDYLEANGHRVHVISIDDFYYDKKFLQRRADEDPDIEIDYDSEDTIDMALLAEKTESLLSCKETRMPRFDFRSGLRAEGASISPTSSDVFLFEGIQILYPRVNAILQGASYRSIYIAPASAIEVAGERFEPNEIRLLRRLVRDYRYRASEPDFTFYLWQSVRANEEKNIFPNAHRCHEVIDSTMPYEIGMLKPYLTDLLARIPSKNNFFEEATGILKKIANVEAIPSEYMASNSLYKEFI